MRFIGFGTMKKRLHTIVSFLGSSFQKPIIAYSWQFYFASICICCWLKLGLISAQRTGETPVMTSTFSCKLSYSKSVSSSVLNDYFTPSNKSSFCLLLCILETDYLILTTLLVLSEILLKDLFLLLVLTELWRTSELSLTFCSTVSPPSSASDSTSSLSPSPSP